MFVTAKEGNFREWFCNDDLKSKLNYCAYLVVMSEM